MSQSTVSPSSTNNSSCRAVSLGILTFGLLYFWLQPYQSITFGAFYRAVLREKGPRPAAA